VAAGSSESIAWSRFQRRLATLMFSGRALRPPCFSGVEKRSTAQRRIIIKQTKGNDWPVTAEAAAGEPEAAAGEPGAPAAPAATRGEESKQSTAQKDSETEEGQWLTSGRSRGKRRHWWYEVTWDYDWVGQIAAAFSQGAQNFQGKFRVRNFICDKASTLRRIASPIKQALCQAHDVEEEGHNQAWNRFPLWFNEKKHNVNYCKNKMNASI
jgi:hypothetical protein